ncbi:MAG: 3-oxoacid CoA-transferase subunit A [Candidatus Izemoplasmatales bacterium]
MKAFITKQEFMKILKDHQTIMVGGFLTNGTPEKLIDYVLESNVSDLTIICNDAGYPDKGVGKLISAGKVTSLYASHIGTNPVCGDMMNAGLIKVFLIPQGTLVEQIRAGGAGLGGILTETGKSTIVAEGKQTVTIKGVSYLVEEAIHADLALLGGCISDRFGNLIYQATKRNFNPIMAMAADLTIANVSEVYDEISPEVVITPSPLVDYIVVGE